MMVAIVNESVGRAFGEPVMDAQRNFRALMAAMAEPGTIHRLRADIEMPAGLSAAATITLLTLADQETPVWMDGDHSRSILAYLRFHTGCPIAATPREAGFAILGPGSAEFNLTVFSPGEDRYPDRSATVIVDCLDFTSGASRRWTGPGIADERQVSACLPHDDLWSQITANHARYPLGVDLILAAGDSIIGLPRSTRLDPLAEAL